MRVFFFSTCLGSSMYADTCINSIKLLQKEGVEVVFKKDQTCCSQPAFNSGYIKEAQEVALHNMRVFAGNEPIILPSGSCTGVMRMDYLELFKDTPHFQEAQKFSQRIFELSEFLVEKLQVKYQDKGEPVKITWHSNCHALRVAKCIDAAKTILNSLENVELIQLDREEECCGFGGTFSIKEPEISNAMVSQKIADIKSKNVEYLIGADAGCLLNISGALKKQGVDIKVMHLYDFLSQRIGLE